MLSLEIKEISERAENNGMSREEYKLPSDDSRS